MITDDPSLVSQLAKNTKHFRDRMTAAGFTIWVNLDHVLSDHSPHGINCFQKVQNVLKRGLIHHCRFISLVSNQSECTIHSGWHTLVSSHSAPVVLDNNGFLYRAQVRPALVCASELYHGNQAS